jgi:hypothetical protein
MRRLFQFFTHQRYMNVEFYKNFTVYKIPLHDDIIKRILDVKIVDNTIIIRAK